MKRSKATRILDARKRNEERAKRTPKEQIARLDKMLGKGKGAKRERQRLSKLI